MDFSLYDSSSLNVLQGAPPAQKVRGENNNDDHWDDVLGSVLSSRSLARLLPRGRRRRSPTISPSKVRFA